MTVTIGQYISRDLSCVKNSITGTTDKRSSTNTDSLLSNILYNSRHSGMTSYRANLQHAK